MRLAIVRQRYNPYGGAERFVERALQSLAASDLQITLIAREWQGEARHQVLRCDPFHIGRLWRDASFSRCVRSAIAAEHFDLVQSHERIPGCDIYRAGDGVHAAWLQHRSRGNSTARRLAQNWAPYHRYTVRAERKMFTHPALRAVICNSRMVADEVARHYRVATDKLHVIYNGVDTEVFHPRLATQFRQQTRTALNIANDVPLLLFVGSGFERKGVPQLLRALALMRRDDARLVLIGADRKLKAMQTLAAGLGIAGRVRFTGPLKDVRPYYGAADGFVLPTLYDPCPNAALEALACGLPTVTSTTCGAQEWIRAGQNGWVVDAVNVPELAARLDDLCAVTGQTASREAARAAVAGLTLDAMANALQALYVNLGAATGRRV